MAESKLKLRRGKKFGILTLLEKVTDTSIPGYKNKWICICECGNEVIVTRYRLHNGKVESCGCLKRRSVRNDRLYKTWNNMRHRCTTDENNLHYKYYGRKGIKVCDRWSDYNNFVQDMQPSFTAFEEIHGENTATLDRIDFNGNYEPSNCRWADAKAQSANRESNINLVVDGIEYKTLSGLARAYGANVGTVHDRYAKGKRGLDLVRYIKKHNI